MKTVRLKGGFVVTPQGVEHTDIILRDGRIELAGDKDRCDQVVDITGKYVVPGFVDIHFHGYNLFEFTAGLYDVKSETFDNSPATYDYGLEMLSKTLIKFGVTGFYVGTWAGPIDNLRNCYAQLYRYLSKTNNQPGANPAPPRGWAGNNGAYTELISIGPKLVQSIMSFPRKREST